MFPGAHHLWQFRGIVLIAAFVVCGVSAGYTADAPSSKGVSVSAAPVNFSAKSLMHDDNNQTVTAIGDVELLQGPQILRADKIVYYLQEDRVTALGNVSLLDERGDVHFAEYVELHNHMKDGFIHGLLTLLADGSRFTAAEAKRENNGTKTTLTDGTYTMCKVCEISPHPLWQIKASEVTHDANAKTVKYKHARLELLGVPVAYTPIFSHPDPTLKRKSGFLRPQYGWSTALGTHVQAGYYYDIAPDKDMTFRLEPTALAGILAEGEWRQRFRNGQLKVNAGTANSDRKEEDGSVSTSRQRGHIFADGRFDLDEKWRGGFDIARASDKQYLRLYDISKENVLSNEVYAERFSGRDYSRVSALSFQDVRLGVRPDQPDILPMMEHSMTGEPEALWGGRWDAGISALGLTRNNDNQNVQRVSAEAGWERHDVSSLGLSTIMRLDGRGDYYTVENSDAAALDPTLDDSPGSGRGLVTASMVSSYPMVRRLPMAQAVIEPVVGVDFGSKANQNDDKIPNEDSIDIQFDTNNLFERNRYPGIDRQEDGGRLNYGLGGGVYRDDGRYGKVFVGQSYRFSGDRIFPEGSGLEDRHSDIVGQVKAGLSRYFDGDYRFQLDSNNLAVRRHEVQAGGGTELFRLNGRYLYTPDVAGTGFNEPRQQLHIDGSYNIAEHWQVQSSALMDFGDQPGFRNASSSLGYSDECFSFSIEGVRNVANEASGDDETKLVMRIGLKSIGEFSGPQIPLGGGSQLKK